MEDDKMIPLSYVSQFGYCKRRTGLLMLEQQWNESVDTAKGSAEHQNVHLYRSAERKGVVTLTDLPVISHNMNLIGRCDAIEATESKGGAVIPFLEHRSFTLYPIEYKHGKMRSESEYELQLCAQAMCLEEMYHCEIHSGAVFYISSHRRKKIQFTIEMRESVQQIAKALSDMLQTKIVPAAEPSPKCAKCSIKDICMPGIAESAADYLKQISREMKE